ncbi:MAG: extracellular solute-binding protein [Pseudomonadota bacterium]
MAEALEFTRDLEFDLALVNSANQIDAAKSKFARGEAAMIIEGVWNLEDYRDAGIEVRQALLPSHPGTGMRMRPLNTVIGWGVSSQSANKPAAADLALWLSSDDAQRRLLEQTLTLPSSQFVKSEALSGSDPLISGFIRQSDHSFTMPMRPRVQQIFLVIDTAIELFISGKSDAESALAGADEEMRAVMSR